MPLTPTDLDLRLHVFEQLYDADCGLQLGLDDTPFSPETEQRRAKEVAQRRRTPLGWDTERLWHFTAAPFDGFPRQDRQAWWRDYLGFTKPSRRGALFRDNSHIPPWMLTLLAVNWHAAPRDLVRQLRHFGTEGLFLRALLHQWSAAELAAAPAWFPAAYPTPAEDFNGESCFSVLDTCLRSVCGALPPGSTRQLFRGVPRKLLDRDRDTEGIFNRALLGLGLPTPADRIHFAKVTGSSVTYATGIVPWLAGTGVAGLELLAKWLTKGSADNCREMLREVARVAHGPGVAGFFLDALDSRVATVATEWLQTHPQALLHAELSSSQADKAVQFLRGVELPDLDPDAPGAGLVKRLRAEAAAPVLAAPPRWWPTTPPGPAVVPFAVADLPPLPVEGGQLAAAQVAQLLGALYEEPTGPLVASVRQNIDAEARDVFAAGVLAAWVNVGAPYKTRWLLEALAEIAGGRFVEQLTPLVSLWPKRSRYPLAFAGVAALGRIGSREAAYALVQLACSGRGTKLENTARDAIAGLAAARGQTPTQIHDWALTTTPLTPQGHTHLTNGTHTYRATLQPDGHLTLHKLNPHHQPTGRPLTTIPPNKHNPTQTQTARTQLKNLRTQITQHITLQNHRYHQAMLTSHRWHPHHFTQHIATHPLTRIIYPGLIWGIWQHNQLQTTAHIDPDGQLTDINDTPIHLTPTHQIDIIHPIDLTNTQTQNWLTHLTDYELTNPLNQLTQPTHHYQHPQQLTPTLPHNFALPRFGEVAEGRSWVYTEYLARAHRAASWWFESLDLSVLIELHGQQPGLLTATAVARRGRIDRATVVDEDYLATLPTLPWKEVPGRITSEVLAFLEQLQQP